MKVFIPIVLLLLISSGTTFAQSTEELVERGRYLAEGIAGCGNCHTPKNPDGTPNTGVRLAGAFVIEEPGLFRAYAPNITMV